MTSIVGVGLYPRHFVPRPASRRRAYTHHHHLSGNRPFISLLLIIFMAFYFFILRPFYKWSRNIIIEILIYYKGLTIASHYCISLLHLTIASIIASHSMVSLLHLTIASIIASHSMVSLLHLTIRSQCDLFYETRTVSSSLRSSAGEPQASIYTTSLHLSGNDPFIGIIVLLFILFIFYC